jgi:hypothetical protein
LGQASVRTVGVIVIDILGQNMAQVALSGNKDPVSAFAANAPDPAFGDRARTRRPHWRCDEPGADRGEHRIEHSGEFGVPVADQEPDLA